MSCAHELTDTPTVPAIEAEIIRSRVCRAVL